MGRGDLARPRHGLGDLPEVQDPARRGDDEQLREPRRGGEHRGRGSARRRSPTATAAPSRRPRRRWPRATGTPASRSPSARATAGTQPAPQVPAAFNTVIAVGGTRLDARGQRAWLERDGLVHEHERGGRQRLLRLHRQARVAARHRLREAHDRRRRRGRRPRHRRDGLRQLRPDTGFEVFGGTSASAPIIAAVFALAGQRRRRSTTRRSSYAHKTSLFDVTTGKNGTLRRLLPVHREGRLRRPDRARHAQGRHGVLNPAIGVGLHTAGRPSSHDATCRRTRGLVASCDPIDGQLTPVAVPGLAQPSGRWRRRSPDPWEAPRRSPRRRARRARPSGPRPPGHRRDAAEWSSKRSLGVAPTGNPAGDPDGGIKSGWGRPDTTGI